MNDNCNNNLKNLCRMCRAWKNENNVDIKGITIDVLAYRFLSTYISFLLVIFNSYTKNFNLVGEANEHIKTANLLWKIREEYISLLIDFEILSVEEIMVKRDELQNRTFEVYSSSLSTDKKVIKKLRKV